MSEAERVNRKLVKDFLYVLAGRDLVDHLDCWEDSDWAFATKTLKNLLTTRTGEKGE